MSTTIKCNKCDNEIEITEAIKLELEKKVLQETQTKHNQELESLKKSQIDLIKQKELEFEKTKLEFSEKARKEALEKVQKEVEGKLKMINDDIESKNKKNKELQDQLIDITIKLREEKSSKDELKLEFEKKLLAEQEKIILEVRQKAKEEGELKMLEKEKVISDMKKQMEEMQRKIEQGSQQTQGEVMELELEELIKREFPFDVIKEVAKGVRGADILQEVKDNRGRSCGIIMWESKNAKWTNNWIPKLKEDMRQAKADLAVLVATDMPPEITTFDIKDNIWIVTRKMAISLAIALRYSLIKVSYEKSVQDGKEEKMETLYKYITGLEFKNRIESIVELFGSLQDDIEKERRYFNTKWAKQEKQLRSVIDHTQGMYGDLQGLIGKSLPTISNLELPDVKPNNTNDLKDNDLKEININQASLI